MTIKTLYPNVRPTLDLAFAATKALDPRITFTRASTGTYVGSNGTLRTAGINEARFDHSPLTLESLGLLVEEARTNLLVRSEEFENVAWTPSNAATPTANIAVAPNGTLTADKIITNNGLSSGLVFQTFALSASTTYTFSAYAKAVEWGWTTLQLRGPENVSAGAWFDLTNGSVGTIDAGVSATIQAVGNGWYRCAVTKTTSTGVSTSRQRIYTTNANSVFTTGDGTSGIYVWGAQLEEGAFPTSYIPTTSATATRAADVASITGSNFSSWYRQNAGTFFWSGSLYNTQYSNQNPFRITEGTNLRGIGFGLDARTGTDDAYFSTRNNTDITSVNSSFPFVIGNSNIRIGGAFETDVAASFNGSAPTVASPVYVFGTENQMEIMGSKGTSGTNNSYNGHTRRLTYWPWRLSNATLQALTS